MEILFENYEEYKQYVKEEWENGAINELFEAGFIVEVEESFDYECESRQINYRRLTEEEFKNVFIVNNKL
jgi:hypothetical protein